MLDIPTLKTTILTSFERAQAEPKPYPHWLLNDVLPESMVDDICALPFAPPDIAETHGRRETHNSTRHFFGAEAQARFPVCAALTEALQGQDCVNALQSLTGLTLSGSFLRVEYCQDSEGFWLEPHTDIGAKFFTMLIYLNNPPPGENWGTDIYASPTQYLGPAPSGRNQGLIFIPGQDTWHGFERRPITGVRRSLIVNYVTPEWRARHELAFEQTPIR